MDGRIALLKHFFTEKEKIILDYNGLRASIFLYESGVHGLRLENENGYIIALPYMGQQIWTATFYGRRLTMKSMFPKPKLTDFLLNTYGCFMMHCGALRMGCPGPEDDHPLHGELPCASYNTADLVFGEDSEGYFIGVTGVYAHDVTFSAHYQAQPLVVIHEDSTLIDLSMVIQNRSKYPMELMYMCHINFLPVDGGRIVQSVPWDKNHMVVRASIPGHVTVSESYRGFLEKLKDNPELTQTLKPEDEYRPEIAFFIQSPSVDSEDFCHYMQIHPDGSADYLRYKPEELDHATRWIIRTGEQEALGIALPATCDPEGYTAEKHKGNIKEIQGTSSARFQVRTGLLDPEQARDMEEHINTILKEGE